MTEANQHSWILKNCITQPYASFRQSNEVYCSKVKVSFGNSSEPFLERGCHWGSASKDSGRRVMKELGYVLEFSDTCGEDYCNKGLQFKVATILVSFSVFINALILLL